MYQKEVIIQGFCLILIAVVFPSFLFITEAATFLTDLKEGRSSELEMIDFSEFFFIDDDTFFIDDMAFRKSDVQRGGFYGFRWTNGNVYYEFDSNLTQQEKNSWLAAAAEWSAAAPLYFIQRTTEYNYIYVQGDTSNWSYVGMIGGMQEMGIFNWDNKFIIAHEIGHALGMIHEHQRLDRDTYVTIHDDNIQSDYAYNFDLWYYSTAYGNYDFDSIMHYDKCSFSIDCPPGYTCNCTNLVISCNPPNEGWTDLIGQRDHLSDLDKSTMAAFYEPIATPTQTPTLTPTNTPTNTPVPTNTPTRTPTRTPTNTPAPTSTPTPTSDCIHTGDINQDGRVTSEDAQMAFMITLGQHMPTYVEACAADCNGDSKVTSADAQLIFQVGLGIAACVDPL